MRVRHSLGVVALVAAGSCAAAAEPSFGQAVETALFDTCMDVAGGKLRMDDEAAMKRLGYSRAPASVESASASSKLGIPLVVSKGEGDRRIVMLTFPGSTLCSVNFSGPDASTVMSSLKARAARDHGTLRPDPTQSGIRGNIRAESYKADFRKGEVFRLMFHSPSSPEFKDANGASIGFTKD